MRVIANYLDIIFVYFTDLRQIQKNTSHKAYEPMRLQINIRDFKQRLNPPAPRESAEKVFFHAEETGLTPGKYQKQNPPPSPAPG